MPLAPLAPFAPFAAELVAVAAVVVEAVAAGLVAAAPAVAAGVTGADRSKSLAPRCCSAVSYTHLDVYKRQLPNCAKQTPRSVAAISNGPSALVRRA